MGVRMKWLFLIFILNSFLQIPIMSDSSSEVGSTEIPKYFLEYAQAREFVDWMVGIRRKTHENPELGYEEFETSKLIREELEKMDIPYQHPVAVTGVVGIIGTGGPPIVAIRAEELGQQRRRREEEAEQRRREERAEQRRRREEEADSFGFGLEFTCQTPSQTYAQKGPD